MSSCRECAKIELRKKKSVDIAQPFSNEHLDEIKAYYEKHNRNLNWFARKYRKVLGHYYRLIIPPAASILEIGCGSADLLALLPNRDVTGIDISQRQVENARQKVPYGTFFIQAGETLHIQRTFDFIILSETVNYAADVQAIFEQLHSVSHSRTRLIINFHNTLWRPILTIAEALALKAPQPASNWLSTDDIINILDLSDWQLVHKKGRILVPFPLFGIEHLFNRLAAPLLQHACLTIFMIARLRWLPSIEDKFVSIIIPTRNEAENIEPAIRRTPELGKGTEIIFVEGHSLDKTWEEIQRVVEAYPHKEIKAIRQSGKGKGNAVREGFSIAKGDILMILDADLTMPPEELPKFYDVLCSGRAEFANGIRLVYPMDKKAMRFINLCGNKFFSIVFSWILGQTVKDTLCGTKAMYKKDYEKIAANRGYFGDFDPFGDFDLLFGASKLMLKISDIPIRYRERSYGETNIRRWEHGWLLIKMVFFAARKIIFV